MLDSAVDQAAPRNIIADLHAIEASVTDVGFLTFQCDFARLVEDGAGASTSFNSPIYMPLVLAAFAVVGQHLAQRLRRPAERGDQEEAV